MNQSRLSMVIFRFFVGGDVARQLALMLSTAIKDVILPHSSAKGGYASTPVKSPSRSLEGPCVSSGRQNGPRRPIPSPTPLGSVGFLKTGLSVSGPLSGELGNSCGLAHSRLGMDSHEEYMVTKGSPFVRSSEVPRFEVDDMRETSENQSSTDSDRPWPLPVELELRWRGDSAIR